jgi:F-type H+-transporting ATPase subunit gamma
MNLRTVRKKIKSIKNVRKITKAMQMVSAVKMRKAQQLEVEGRAYREGLREIIGKIAAKIDLKSIKLFDVDTSEANRELVLVISSNKGLAGSFNVNIMKGSLSYIKDFSKTDIVTVGSKGSQFFARVQNANVLADFSHKNPIIQVSAIFDYILNAYNSGSYKKISLIYSKYISTTKSDIRVETLLPFENIISEIANLKAESKIAHHSELIIEPNPIVIVKEILMSFLENDIRGAILSSEAVEHSARMMAMKSATDNATEIIYQMTLLSNRLRQEKITNELLDMITAKESVS